MINSAKQTVINLPFFDVYSKKEVIIIFKGAKNYIG